MATRPDISSPEGQRGYKTSGWNCWKAPAGRECLKVSVLEDNYSKAPLLEDTNHLIGGRRQGCKAPVLEGTSA